MAPLIRPLARDEVDLVVEFAAREGWNPGLHDAGAFHATDPGGFLGAEMGGEVVGCVSAVRYGPGFGFLGCYIVVPGLRGRGIGRALWKAAIDRLGRRTVGLDGVPAQQENYRRSGFRLAWPNARFAGPARHGGRPPAAIVPLPSVPLAAVAADDGRVFPAPRSSFLRAWIALPESRGLAWVEPDGRLRGWGVIRRCRSGHKVGPLVADDPAIASELFDALAATVPAGDEVFLDVPLPNTAAVALAEARGMAVVFHTARMYANGPAPVVERERIFGVTTFELG